MAKTFVSRTNGLELHIPADMGGAVKFFSVGEEARALIDDGSVAQGMTTPEQLQSELNRAKAKIEALEAEQAKAATKSVAPKAAKASAPAEKAAEKETELA